MNPKFLIPLTAAMLGLAACAPDEDGDGFNANDDCDDTNADANPNGTEVRGNDVDEDCDGDALPFRYVGDWSLSRISAVDDGYDLFGTTSNTGTLQITEALATTVDVTAAEDGYAYEIDLNGTAAPDTSNEDAFSLNLSGTLKDTYDDTYSVTTDWDCSATDNELECNGTLQYEAYQLDTTAVFTK